LISEKASAPWATNNNCFEAAWRATAMYDRGVRTVAFALVIAAVLSSHTKEIRWEHLSSRTGDLPSPVPPVNRPAF